MDVDYTGIVAGLAMLLMLEDKSVLRIAKGLIKNVQAANSGTQRVLVAYSDLLDKNEALRLENIRLNLELDAKSAPNN